MANGTRNDRGERIWAVGAPGSPARVRDERPVLLERIARAANWAEVTDAIAVACLVWPLSRLEITSLLEVAGLIPKSF